MTTKKLTSFRIVGPLHLWLGLASGLVVFIVALTGAMYVFQEEIETRLIHPNRHFVAEQNQPFAPMSVWLSQANAAFAAYDSLDGSRNVYWHREAGRTVSIGTRYQDGGGEHYIEAFLNPYTGQVLEVAETYGPTSFWRIVIDLHVNLLLGKFGRYVVRYGTLIFLILLISGIVLWWPKNKAALKQRYTFTWKSTTRWKRKNYDLHNVPGFYASWVVVFMAITGLVWSFQWFDKGLYYVLSGGEVAAEPPRRISDTLTATHTSQLEICFNRFRRDHPVAHQQANAFYVSYPTNKGEGDVVIYAYSDPAGPIATDYAAFLYDRVTTRFIQQGFTGRTRQNAGDWFRDFNGSIHYGSIFGLPSKLLVFFACLIAASLPVTGFLIWWGRQKKKKPVAVRSITISKPIVTTHKTSF